MGKKKMKLSSLFRGGAGGLLAVHLCYNNAKTLSIRLGDDMIKTVNFVFFDHNHHNGDVLEAETPESWFTNSSETASHSTDSDQDLDAESLEMVVRGVVRSERLFFDPGVTSSILEESKTDSDSKAKSKSKEDRDRDQDCIYTLPIEEISVAVAMESEDPYGDFRRSMEEMVRSHGELAKDWTLISNICYLVSWVRRKLLKLRPLVYDFVKKQINNGLSTMFWIDNWNGLGKIQDIIGDNGTQILGISKWASVASVAQDGQWVFRRVRSQVATNIVSSISQISPPNPNLGDDITLWRHSPSEFKSDFSASSTWDQIRVVLPKLKWAELVWFSYGNPRQSTHSTSSSSFDIDSSSTHCPTYP